MSRKLTEILSDPTPPISVIVPLYNKGAYLEEAISGIFLQDYPSFEILIRDDGSSDSSYETMKRLLDIYPDKNIRIFYGENLGASACRNFLIEQASHQLIILMDADDIMLPGFVNKALQAMRQDNARVVYSDVELTGVKTGEWCPQPFDQYTIRYDNCLTSLALLDREIWVEIGGYEPALPFNEDWSFFIRAAAITNRFHKLSGKYFRYRQTESGLYQTFINENWVLNRSLVMLASPELYPVSEIIDALKNLADMPEVWIAKYEECARKHPTRTLVWIVLAAAALGKSDHERFIICLDQAIQHSNDKDWIPFFLRATYLETSNPMQAASYYHYVRIRRPDMGLIVNEKIKRILENNALSIATVNNKTN